MSINFPVFPLNGFPELSPNCFPALSPNRFPTLFPNSFPALFLNSFPEPRFWESPPKIGQFPLGISFHKPLGISFQKLVGICFPKLLGIKFPKNAQEYKHTATEWLHNRCDTATEHLYYQIRQLLKNYNCGGRWNLEAFKVDVATEMGKKQSAAMA